MIEFKFKDGAMEKLLQGVEVWFEHLPEVAKNKSDLAYIEPESLMYYFMHHGADFGTHFDLEREKAFAKLKQPTNKYRRPGMDAVWGHEYMANFNRYTTAWAKQYESVTGRKLPVLRQKEKPEKSSESKTGGMRHFLGEMTAYAGGYLSTEEFHKRIKTRVINGRLMYDGAPRENLIKADWLPDDKQYSASTPPGYVAYTVGAVRSRSFEHGVPGIAIMPNNWRPLGS